MQDMPLELEAKIERLGEILAGSRGTVFFGGAGTSTESGIPDFRSQDGLYAQKFKYPPERILSRTFFDEHTDEFFAFYREKMLFLDAEPNAAHRALAAMEGAGRLEAVITQNIDGLHQKAGSKNVLELHGSVHRNHCMGCGRAYGVSHVAGAAGAPRCECGGIVKPDVVLYEEGLDSDTLRRSAELISGADTLIVGGTSLTVYPAAGFVDFFEGRSLVVINRSPTSADKAASLVINAGIAQVLGSLRILR
ncbi:MAG: NAD-dependent protein deacylase [Clostridiales bacterium]|jgi:NAD-dependent deacetylase|nr:NAD-dependent protein deacylase [Clostridiales bacterium]